LGYGWRIVAILAIRGFARAQSGVCDFEQGLARQQAGQFAEAAAAYQACITAEPARIEARSNLGTVYVRMGRFGDAIAQYREALRIAPAQFAPNLRLNLALAYYKSSQVPAAATELEPLHAAQPGNLDLTLLLADCRLRMGEFQKAIDVAAPLESAYQDDAALNYVLGMALIRSGRVAEGQVRVDRILRRGDSAEGHFLLGSALFGAGDYPGAVKELNRAAALNGDLPSLQSYLGKALLFTGDADGAVAAFRKELAANPNDFDANFQLASILARRGRQQEARELIERAVQVRPDSAEARAALTAGVRLQPGAADDPGIPVGAPAPPVGPLTFSALARPVALIFGSYTCPKLRTSAPELKRIAAEYHEQVDFRLVYISEAHAAGGPAAQWQSTINSREGIDLPSALSLGEKQEHANLCLRKLQLPFALAVDGMDAAAERAYNAWPSRLYLVGRDGKVVYQTRLGELDFDADDLERAIHAMLGTK
jgi:tetratricopeptide (TPR) repeat protein